MYVGVSAGSIAVASIFAETYGADRSCAGIPLTSEEVVFPAANGETRLTFVTATGMGLTRFAVIPHFESKEHLEASSANAEKWASRLSVPFYAIDDETAIIVKDDSIDVVSEGKWKLFNPDKIRTLQ